MFALLQNTIGLMCSDTWNRECTIEVLNGIMDLPDAPKEITVCCLNFIKLGKSTHVGQDVKEVMKGMLLKR